VTYQQTIHDQQQEYKLYLFNSFAKTIKTLQLYVKSHNRTEEKSQKNRTEQDGE